MAGFFSRVVARLFRSSGPPPASFLAPDGLMLHVADYPAIGPVRGLPVICLHGLTRNGRDFDALAPAIARTGRRVIVPDMRGRGASARDPDFRNYRLDVYVRDVVAILDHCGIERAVVIGTSMGGLIAMLMAVSAPGRIAGAVLNDVGPVLNPAGLMRIAAYVGRDDRFASWDAFAAVLKASQGKMFPAASGEFWRVFAHRVGREINGEIALDYDPAIARALMLAGFPPPDLRPAFAALAMHPVLVLRGGLSDILLPEGVEIMRALAPGLESIEIADTGHAPTLDEPSSRAAILSFLDRIP